MPLFSVGDDRVPNRPARQRYHDPAEPPVCWLMRALEIEPQAMEITCLSSAEASSLHRRINRIRQHGKFGHPGTFDPSPTDPEGEGLGFFDRIRISRQGCKLYLASKPEIDIKPIEVKEI